MNQYVQSCRFFLCLSFVFAGLFLFSAQSAFASTPHHTTIKHHTSQYTNTQPSTGVLFASDVFYDEVLFFNDDEYRGTKNLSLSSDAKDSSTKYVDACAIDDDSVSLCAKSVHEDYFLDEKISEKTTTSQ